MKEKFSNICVRAYSQEEHNSLLKKYGDDGYFLIQVISVGSRTRDLYFIKRIISED